MILSIVSLFAITIYFFITTMYYRNKYLTEHNLVEILDESTLMYYRQMVDIDIENDTLKKSVDILKLEIAELRSKLYMGFSNNNIGGDAK